MAQRYFGEWKTYEDVAGAWNGYYHTRAEIPNGFPTPDEILIAIYDIDGYEGQSFVLYEKDGKLFENNSSHCSCNGLEWGPEETSWEALAIRPRKDRNNRDYLDSIYGRSGDDPAVVRYWQLVDEHTAKRTAKQ